MNSRRKPSSHLGRSCRKAEARLPVVTENIKEKGKILSEKEVSVEAGIKGKTSKIA